MTSSRPKVATNSLNHSGPELRAWVETSIAGSPNMTFATMEPTHAPATCAVT